MRLVTGHIPLPTAQDVKEAVRWAEERYVRSGVTSCKETYFPGRYEQVMAAYASLAEDGQLHLRPLVLRQVETAEDVLEARELGRSVEREPGAEGTRWASGIGGRTPRPRFGGVKIFLDGSLVARTAWLGEAYPRRGQAEVGPGRPAMEPDRFREIVAVATREGLPVAVHAIGDRAAALAVETLSATGAAGRLGHSVVHALLISDEVLQTAVAGGVVIETQPALLAALGSGYARTLDWSRLDRLVPMRTLLDAGAVVGSGSDAPTGPPSPAYGLWAACTRPDPEGGPAGVFGAEQRVSVAEALRTYTTLAATCVRAPGELGSISPGAVADLVVWERDLLAIPPDELRELRPVATFVGGEVAFAADDWRG